MANYVRKLVSGQKARFKDEDLDLDLDLVYVTDHIIIMGYPADGIEGFYRNRREDAKKFLDHRHKNDYWIFNFCPVTENSYNSSFFNGRVSRYPFPDHHAPPLAILALAAREMRVWLDGSRDRVVVLHCKAGKGRSGTLACAYMLSLDIPPGPPKLERSYNKKQWAQMRAQEVMDTVETDDMPVENGRPQPLVTNNIDEAGTTEKPLLASDLSAKSIGTVGSKQEQVPLNKSATGSDSNGSDTASTLDRVLSLHTSRRMKQSSSPSSGSDSPPKKLKQGVSIPSQRRYLFYWSLVLSRTAPAHFWPLMPQQPEDRPKVKLLNMTVRLCDPGNAKMTIVRTINKVLNKTVSTGGKKITYGQGRGNVWASLARYDDNFVEKLESWERHTRDEGGHFGKRRNNSELCGEELVSDIFKDGKWDKGKMVRNFAKLGRTGKKMVDEDEREKKRIYTHVLTPLNQSKWNIVKKSIKENPTPAANDSEVPPAMKDENEASSFEDTEEILIPEDGIVLDAGREVRVKLYMGQVFMGWLWFIPCFHMPQPPPSTPAEIPPPTHWKLTRKEVDFPLGIGAWIVDIDIQMVWLPLGTAADPPKRQTSLDSATGEVAEPVSGGLIASVTDMATGGVVASAVETVQAARD